MTIEQGTTAPEKLVEGKSSHEDDLHDDMTIDNLPNRITLFRMFLVPIVSACLLIILWNFDVTRPYHNMLGWIAGWTFTVASITDFFDGYIARLRNIQTIFGSFLDPIADKFLVVTSLILLQSLDRIPTLLVVVLVLREIYMTSLRLLAVSEGISVPVSNMGKWKTATQMTGIPMLMANAPLFRIPLPQIGIICIYIAAFLSLHSALLYSILLVKKLKSHRQEKKKLRREKQMIPVTDSDTEDPI